MPETEDRKIPQQLNIPYFPYFKKKNTTVHFIIQIALYRD